MTKRRFTPQIRQEQISRRQLAERLVTFGWLATSPEVDLGEDFIVHIYFDGRATGVTFHIQEKSVTNLLKRKSGNFLVYSLKVSDLEHWEAFSLPVVVIIWDVKRKEGRWGLVKDLIPQLDQYRPKWRTQTTVSVRIPWANTTDDAGLDQLKASIGHHVYPLISLNKELKLRTSLAFSDTPEGHDARDAFERHIKEGEPVTLKGRVIQELAFSDWWDKWFGGYDPDKVEIHLGITKSSRSFSARADMLSRDGESVSVSNIELRVIQSGTELVRLSNDHQASALGINLSFRRIGQQRTSQVTFFIRNARDNVRETQGTLRFLSHVSSGGKLRLEISEVDQQLVFDFPPQSQAPPGQRLVDLINKLCVIQDRSGHIIRIPEAGITPTDVAAIDELSEIYRVGMTRVAGVVVTVELKGEALDIILDVHKQGKPLHFIQNYDDSHMDIFGMKISTGHMKREIFGFLDTPPEQFEKEIRSLSPEHYLPIQISNTEVIETFRDYKDI